MKRRCGEWCRTCRNILRVKIKEPRYKKAESEGRGRGIALLKSDLRKNPNVKATWMAMHGESIHLKAGGRSRINKYKKRVTKASEVMEDIVAPSKEFWELPEYRAEWGSPRKTKAKVVERYVVTDSGKRKKVKGVYVRTGRKGVHQVMNRARESARLEEERHNGDYAVAFVSQCWLAPCLAIGPHWV